jgi:hypothetical protein
MEFLKIEQFTAEFETGHGDDREWTTCQVHGIAKDNNEVSFVVTHSGVDGILYPVITRGVRMQNLSN